MGNTRRRACRCGRTAGAAHSIRAVPDDPLEAATRPWECPGNQRDVASFIRRARETCGLTQRQLAERLGSTQSVVARWETGDHEITMKALTRIADALEVEILVSFGSKETSWRRP